MWVIFKRKYLEFLTERNKQRKEKNKLRFVILIFFHGSQILPYDLPGRETVKFDIPCPSCAVSLVRYKTSSWMFICPVNPMVLKHGRFGQ
jgi:hypothetical protein